MRVPITILSVLIIAFANAQSDSKPGESLQLIYKIADKDTLRLYAFAPIGRTKQAKAAIVIFHGGGWSIGHPTWAFERARRFASKGLWAIAVQYRLSNQKNTTPIDAIQDAQDAMLWLRRNSSKFPIHPDSIVAYGWSAGAHLAASTAVFPVFDAVDKVSSVPNAMVLYSPAVSLTKDEWFKKLLPKGTDPLKYSPAENIAGKMPPSIIVVGRTDTVTPVYEAELFHGNMEKNDNKSILRIYEGVGHLFTPSNEPDDGFPNPDPAVVAEANKDIDSFLQELGFMD